MNILNTQYATEVLILSIVCGIFIEVVFLLLKSLDRSNNFGLPANEYSPIPVRMYLGVTEYVNGAAGFSLANYLSFRFIPPFVIFLLEASIISKYFPEQNMLAPLLITLLVSALFRDIFGLLSSKKLLAEKIIHASNLAIVFLLALLVYWIGTTYDISFLAPNLNGIMDNLWSSLLGASLVALYVGSINRTARSRNEDAVKDKYSRDQYIISSFSKIRDAFSSSVETAASENEASASILYAILIYENMNRPGWIRKIENLIVKITKRELTIGIAQVKSSKVITDEESIMQAGKLLKNTKGSGLLGSKCLEDKKIASLLTKYNGSKAYNEQIGIILDALTLYETSLTT